METQVILNVLFIVTIMVQSLWNLSQQKLNKLYRKQILELMKKK